MASVHTPTTPTRSLPSPPARRNLVELGRKVGALDVVEVEGVDDALVRGGVLVHAEDEPRPARPSDAVRTELGQMIALRRVVGVVPVPDVDEIDFAWGQPAGQSTSWASGPAEGSVPRSRVDSACPTWRRFGSGSCGPIGSTKSRCRHWVMRTVATGRQLSEGTASRSGTPVCVGGDTVTRRSRHTVHEGHAVVRAVAERARTVVR